MNATITEPGLYPDLRNATYHAQTDWVSSTMLKALLPEHYRLGGNQDALDFGTLFHTVVLEPDSVDAYVALDAHEIGRKADGSPATNPTMTAAWKRAVAEVESDGRTVVSQSDLDRALSMRDAVMAHETAADLLFSNGGRSELSAFAVDSNGVQHKARFDRFIPGTIIDLKSTASKPGERSLTRTAVDYGYDLSAAHYLAVAELLGLQVDTFTLVFVGKEAPYRVTVCDLDDMFVKRGMDLRAHALERAARKVEPYEGATGRLTLLCPEWALPEDDMEFS